MKQHPKPNDHGQAVIIRNPSEPSPIEAWHDPHAVATCVPGGDMPPELNGIAFSPWHDHPTCAGDWEHRSDVALDLVEPPMRPPPGMRASAGVVTTETDGRVWIVHPTNGFGGYLATWPKGRVEGELSLQATAVREAWEEAGLRVRITGLLGDFDRTTTRTRLYLAERLGGTPSDMGWESQAVSLAPVDALPRILNGAADGPVIAALNRALAEGISGELMSRTMRIHREQAEMFALLVAELSQAHRTHVARGGGDFNALPEYRRFVLGAYATGFVCRDYAPQPGYAELREAPAKLQSAPFRVIRHFVHTLLRDERWAGGTSSPVHDMIESGALQIIARRIEAGDFNEPDPSESA